MFVILFLFPFSVAAGSVVLACVSVWVHSLRSDLKNRETGRGTTQGGREEPGKSFQESLGEEQSQRSRRTRQTSPAGSGGCGPLTFQSCWQCWCPGDCRTLADHTHVRVACKCVQIHNSVGCTHSRRNTDGGVPLGAGRTIM